MLSYFRYQVQFFATAIFLFFSSSYSQLQGTWEQTKTHEIYLTIKNGTDTTLIDTTKIEPSEYAFYVFTSDTMHQYDLDYEDSRQRNCYMLWSLPYTIANDTTFILPPSEHVTAQVAVKYEITGDSLIITELWWEDSPTFIYHQSKYFYFVKRINTIVPPLSWPTSECHSANMIPFTRLGVHLNTPNIPLNNVNLLGQISKMTSSGLTLTQGKKSINTFKTK